MAGVNLTAQRIREQGIARHDKCNVTVSDWPYECISKDKNPNAIVYACHDHGAWWWRVPNSEVNP